MNNKLIKLLLVSSFLLAFNSTTYAKPTWLRAIGTEKAISEITSVEASASVKVSDGLQYQTNASWQSSDYVIFNLVYPDRNVRLGKQGLYYWSANQEKQNDANQDLRDFIFGHQFHAELLFTSKFVKSISEEKKLSAECKCYFLEAIDLEGNEVEYHVDKSSKKLVSKITHNKKHGKISVFYNNWKKTGNLILPQEIKITHDGRVFKYSFDKINFNTDQLYKSLRTPYKKLTDSQKIRRLHQDMMDAHIHSDASLMEHIWADEITMVNRGKINQVSGKAASEMMSQSLSMRKHSQYIDLEAPNIEVSDDKSLAYLMVRVKAVGNAVKDKGKLGEQFEFTSAWMATFKKFEGEWKMTANASNFE